MEEAREFTALMPNVFTYRGWRYFFYSNENNEPPHVHVRKDGREVKIWLHDISLASNRHCTDKEINTILKKVKQEQDVIMEAWNAHFGN